MAKRFGEVQAVAEVGFEVCDRELLVINPSSSESHEPEVTEVVSGDFPKRKQRRRALHLKQKTLGSNLAGGSIVVP